MRRATRRTILAAQAGLLVAASLGVWFAHRRATRLEERCAALAARVARLERDLEEARAAANLTPPPATPAPLPAAPQVELSPPARPPEPPAPPPRESAPQAPEREAPRATELTPRPAAASAAAPISLGEVARRGRGRVLVPLTEGAFTLELVHVGPGVGSVGVDPESWPAAERAARALLPATGFSSPRVRVALEEGFLLGAREVTNGEYLAVLAAAGIDLAARRDRRGYLAHLEQVAPGWEDQPVRGVSWDEASEFCALLGRVLEAPVRLPSELEWELAAAGLGDAPRRYPWGEADAGEDVTPEGARDLGGSLHEWCLEPWDSRRWSRAVVLLHRPSLVRAGAPSPSDAMTCRGGGRDSRLQLQSECVWRQGRLAGTRSPGLGFRIAIPVE